MGSVIRVDATKHLALLLNQDKKALTSDDESDHGEGKWSGGYVVRVVSWRSEELNQLLRDVDDLAVLLRYKEPGERGRGAQVRDRYRVYDFPEKGRRAVPFTFPRNCYNERWVDALSPRRRAIFEEECGEPISLTIDPSVKRSVNRSSASWRPQTDTLHLQTHYGSSVRSALCVVYACCSPSGGCLGASGQ